MRLVPKLWTVTTPPRPPKYRRRDPEAGIDGLIHASELLWGGPKNIRPSDVLAEGDEVEAVVVEVDATRRRLGLSRRRALPGTLWPALA